MFLISDRAVGQRRQQQRDTSMEVEDVCGSEGVCEVMCDVPCNEPQHEESMEAHVLEEEPTQDASSGSVEESTDFPAAVHSNANVGTEPPKLRFSNRLEVCNGCQFIYLINKVFILI